MTLKEAPPKLLPGITLLLQHPKNILAGCPKQIFLHSMENL